MAKILLISLEFTEGSKQQYCQQRNHGMIQNQQKAKKYNKETSAYYAYAYDETSDSYAYKETTVYN